MAQFERMAVVFVVLVLTQALAPTRRCGIAMGDTESESSSSTSGSSSYSSRSSDSTASMETPVMTDKQECVAKATEVLRSSALHFSVDRKSEASVQALAEFQPSAEFPKAQADLITAGLANATSDMTTQEIMAQVASSVCGTSTHSLEATDETAAIALTSVGGASSAAGQSDAPLDQKMSTLISDLKAVLAAPSSFVGNHKLVQRMRTELPDEELEYYEGIEGRGEVLRMLQFRLKWAQKRLDGCQLLSIQGEKLTKREISKGKYIPFMMIAKAQGGRRDRDALRAAANYCMLCMVMKGSWLRYNGMTTRLDFYYVEFGKRDIFDRSWGEFTKTCTPALPDPASSSLALEDAKAASELRAIATAHNKIN